MNDMVLLGRLLLAAVFAVAGVAKLLDISGSRASLAAFGVPSFLTGPLSWFVPFIELACAVALIPVSTAWWGASGALAMLSVFSAAIAINLARGRRPDCHCFGQLHSSPVGWRTLVRNLALAALALFVVWQGPANASVGDSVAGLSRSEFLVLLLVIAVAALAAFEWAALVHVLRQNGRLLLRLEAVEGKLGLAGSASAGLPVNSVAPGFRLTGLDGKMVTLDMLRERGKPLLLFFSEPGCGACDGMLRDLARWQQEHADRLSIIPITRADPQMPRTKGTKHVLQDVLFQADREVAQAYRVEGTPSAVLVTDGRISSALATGADAIRGLVVNATLPPPMKQGDRVPRLQLSGLSGKDVDLANLRGRRTLLLFWNPTCGFCQAMLDDVKALERNRPKDAPELLIISAGSSAANRAQGFRSRVLLDPQFSVGGAFGAGGTPSAVMLDEEGRVASEVGMGAQAVLALAGAVSDAPREGSA